jgi:hypothetical protein
VMTTHQSDGLEISEEEGRGDTACAIKVYPNWRVNTY